MILAATMWDDGLTGDLKLMEMLRKMNATAAFALSPGRYKSDRCVNDPRGQYGTLVSRAELKEFADFEVVNHTSNHLDLKKIDAEKTRIEITEGRERLEDLFGRRIDGFCYPYGVHTDVAIKVLRETNARYARTTQEGHTSYMDRMFLHTTARWNGTNLLDLIDRASGNLILWGHTYEIQSPQDWDKVREMYTVLTQHPKVKLVTFEEMIKV